MYTGVGYFSILLINVYYISSAYQHSQLHQSSFQMLEKSVIAFHIVKHTFSYELVKLDRIEALNIATNNTFYFT